MVYRSLIAIRGCWILVQWLLGWGVYSRISLFTLNHPYAALVADAIAVAFWLTMLAGLWFFQRWARLIFVVLFCPGIVHEPVPKCIAILYRRRLSFVAPVGIFMLLVTVAILAMSFLRPVRGCFAAKVA